MFTTFIVQPIFNILTLIYALIPGHNFGVAIILFTVVARVALYPMLKKQLKHTKSMRELQPEIKKIKASTKGDKKAESAMVMELYKEREIKPMAYLGLMVLQVIIFLALFQGLNRVVRDPQQIYDFSYAPVQSLSYMQEINNNPESFDNTFVGVVDLSRSAIDSEEGFYLPAFILVFGSALIQFFQIRQTMPSDKDSRKLRDILKDSGDGKKADNAEMNAAMTRNMGYIMPIVIFIITIGFPAALSLYWFVGGLIAFMQQYYLLKQDEYMMVSAEVVSKKPLKKNKDLDVTAKKSKDKTKKSGEVTVTTRTIQSNKPKAKKKKSNKRKR